MNQFVRLACVALAGLAGGCANNSGSPADGPTESQAAAYSVGAGHGRIYARALYNHDGTASFAVSTSWLDAWWAGPGVLEALQVQVRDRTTGAVVATLDETDLDARSTYNWLAPAGAHLDPWTIEATVRGVFSDHPLPITLAGVVNLRPAVVVAPDRGVVAPDRGHGVVAPDRGVVAPDRPEVGDAAFVHVIMSETNGETGAVLDCVLRFDGVVQERNVDMFVPAGLQRPCDFVTTFPTAGDVAVSVSVENIRPAEDVQPQTPPPGGNATDPHTVTDVVHVVAPDRDHHGWGWGRH